jgi:hypothetical protein
VLSLDLDVPREVEHRANRAVFHVGECGTFGPIITNKADNHRVVAECMRSLYEKRSYTYDLTSGAHLSLFTRELNEESLVLQRAVWNGIRLYVNCERNISHRLSLSATQARTR